MSHKVTFRVDKKEKITIKQIIEFYNSDKNNLISILQEIQEFYGFLPRNIIYYISRKLKIPIAEIFGIATFYKQFKFNKIGKNFIICCDGTACHVKGSTLIINFLEGILGIKSGGTTRDGLFSLETVACLGCCAISPVCIINGNIYGNLTTNKIIKVLNKLKKEI